MRVCRFRPSLYKGEADCQWDISLPFIKIRLTLEAVLRKMRAQSRGKAMGPRGSIYSDSKLTRPLTTVFIYVSRSDILKIANFLAME